MNNSRTARQARYFDGKWHYRGAIYDTFEHLMQSIGQTIALVSVSDDLTEATIYFQDKENDNFDASASNAERSGAS